MSRDIGQNERRLSRDSIEREKAREKEGGKRWEKRGRRDGARKIVKQRGRKPGRERLPNEFSFRFEACQPR